MENQTITIGGKLYPLKFGFAAFRTLGILWKLPGAEEVGERISQEFGGAEDGKFTFKQNIVLNEIIYSAILASESDTKKRVALKKEITPDDVGTAVMVDPDLALEIITDFMQAIQPGAITAGKQKSGPEAKK